MLAEGNSEFQVDSFSHLLMNHKVEKKKAEKEGEELKKHEALDFRKELMAMMKDEDYKESPPP